MVCDARSQHPRELRAWTGSSLFHQPASRQHLDAGSTCRYAVLAEYGGFYIDLDIQCRRPLDFLRRYPLVLPATRPVGFSNDFLAAAPRHPLMLQMLQALPAWSVPLITKYPTVMFSTGPMFVTLQVRPCLLLQPFEPLGALHRLCERSASVHELPTLVMMLPRPHLQSCPIGALLPAHQL